MQSPSPGDHGASTPKREFPISVDGIDQRSHRARDIAQAIAERVRRFHVGQLFAHPSAVRGDNNASLSDLAPDPVLFANFLHWWQEAVASGEDRCQRHRKRGGKGSLEFDRNSSRLLNRDGGHRARLQPRARLWIPNWVTWTSVRCDTRPWVSYGLPVYRGPGNQRCESSSQDAATTASTLMRMALPSVVIEGPHTIRCSRAFRANCSTRVRLIVQHGVGQCRATRGRVMAFRPPGGGPATRLWR